MGFNDVALHDGEEDLDLVQPGCVDGQVDEFRVGQVSCIWSMERGPLCDEQLSLGTTTGTPEDALDTACNLYLAGPTDWP